ncbi:hypothetical protein WH47_01962 [Habropoda laboriosa]|uniref:Uncharacterized protein n=1 Tax=Habropoda laboriosa TaxID=597456 RepID=A0A0L7QXY2_9HYME|nr:hypothetical protein WH47_01962 [Habropoda laboriosa]
MSSGLHDRKTLSSSAELPNIGIMLAKSVARTQGALALQLIPLIRPGFYFPSKPPQPKNKPVNERGRPTMLEPQTWRPIKPATRIPETDMWSGHPSSYGTPPSA